MTEIIVAPDTEAIVVTALNAQSLPGSAQALTETPNTLPATFVKVLVLGGPGRDFRVMQTSTVAIESWDSDDAGAYELANYADAVMLALPELVASVYSVATQSAPANRSDENTGTHSKYAAIYEITVRASAS